MKDSLILVDTSIWIDALRKPAVKGISELLGSLLLEHKISMHPLVKLELLSGTTQDSEFNKLYLELSALEELEVTPEVWELASQWGFQLRRKGLTIPNTDLLIAVTVHFYHAFLWHQDKHYDLIAKYLDIKMFKG